MSAPVSKPTYASVVAGTAHSNPSTKGSVASRRKNTTAKPRSRQTIQPRIEVPYVAEATPLQSSGIQVTDDVKVEPVPSVLPSITETRAEGSVSADASSDREDADPNRLYDPEDSVYRGPSSVNRVQNDSPAAVSVIQTRAAKARASNVLSTPGTSGSTFLASRPAGSSTKGAIASEPDGSDVDGGSDGEHVSPNHSSPHKRKRSSTSARNKRASKRSRRRIASESEQDADSAEASSDSDGVDAQYYKDKDLDRYDSSSSFIDDTIIDVDADLDEAAKREVSKKREAHSKPLSSTQVGGRRTKESVSRQGDGALRSASRKGKERELAVDPFPVESVAGVQRSSGGVSVDLAPVDSRGVASRALLPGYSTPPTSSAGPIDSGGSTFRAGLGIPTPLTPTNANAVPGPSSSGSSIRTPTQRRVFGALVEPSPAFSSSQTTLEDQEFNRVTDLPATCEVTDIELQDKLLRGLYIGLACLRAGVFESWSDMVGPGTTRFSGWGNSCPSMDFDSCMSAMQFTQSGSYINPSRVSPRDVLVRSIAGAQQRFHLYTGDRRPAVCVSSIYCTESCLTAPSSRGLRQKFVSGIYHSQEWERFVGFVCTTFREHVLQAQMHKDAIQFATKAMYSKSRNGYQTPSSSSAMPSSMFSNTKSPSSSGRTGAVRAPTSDNFVLDCDAEVPVYDARNFTVDFDNDLEHIDELPRWRDEIPFGSFTVVAYTVAVYKAQSSKWHVSLNIKWAMVLGIPEV